METTSRKEIEYEAAIARVLRFVQSALDETITPRQLAEIAGFSPHHFHRIFRAMVGESVMDFVRRLRLERAAYRLKSTAEPVATLAFDGGYGSQEAFARAFAATYGLPPREYRRTPTSHEIPCPSGVHYDPTGFTPLRFAPDADLLAHEGLCDFHRHWPDPFEAHADRLTALLKGYAAFVFPPPPQDIPMTEATTDIDREIEALQKAADDARQRLAEARRRRPKEPVADYLLKNPDGSDVHLSELFGAKGDLILIHNMGAGCPGCTMAGDGFSGLAPHLSDRAAFVVCSPDRPEVMKRFAERRGWRFRMVSAYDTTLFQDLGFWGNGPWPGVSTFRREPDGSVVRVAKDFFDGNDVYCGTGPLFDLLQEGAAGWEPKFDYSEPLSPLGERGRGEGCCENSESAP